jgi:hypothetical protein
LVATKKLSEDIFIIDKFNYEQQIFTPASRRKEVQQAKSVSQKRKTRACEEHVYQRLDQLAPKRKARYRNSTEARTS